MPSPLAALSPLDGRYARTVDPLRVYFSEQALIRYRVRIELEWLQALAAERAIRELKPFSARRRPRSRELVKDFSERDAEHDQEHRGRDQPRRQGDRVLAARASSATTRRLQRALEFIHFACTSEDINNLAYALMLRRVARRA